MGHGGDDVGPPVAVDVQHVDEARRAELEIGVPLPLAGARVRRRLEPALGRDDVDAAVAVDVARADAVAEGFRADDVLHEAAVFMLIPRGGRVRAAILRQDAVLLAAVREVHQERELDEVALVDNVFLPRRAGLARILHPHQLVLEAVGGDDVHFAVAVHIQRQIRENIDVTGDVGDVAEFVRRPLGRFVPILAGDDIELAVSIDVGEGRRFAGAAVDHQLLERHFRRTRNAPQREGARGGRGQCPNRLSHCDVPLSPGISALVHAG